MITFYEFCSVESAMFGIASSVSFAFGTLSLRPKGITQICRTYYSYNKYVAQSLSAQKAQYIIGALYLFLSFTFQWLKTFLSKEILSETINHVGELATLSFLTIGLIVCLYALLYYTIKNRTIESVTNMVLEQDYKADQERKKRIKKAKN
jgi:drug/metabolite transporter (DMT)-like permease